MRDEIDVGSVWQIGDDNAEEVEVEEVGVAGRDAESAKYRDGVAFVRYRILSAYDGQAHRIDETEEMLASAFVEAFARVDADDELIEEGPL